MKITEEEFKRQMEQYVKEQYDIIKETDRRPNGMFGHWGWRLETERQFKKILEKNGVTVDNNK